MIILQLQNLKLSTIYGLMPVIADVVFKSLFFLDSINILNISNTNLNLNVIPSSTSSPNFRNNSESLRIRSDGEFQAGKKSLKGSGRSLARM